MVNIRLIRDHEFLHGNQHGTLDLETSREALCQLLAEGTNGTGSKPGAHDLLFDVRNADIDMTLKEVWVLLGRLDECNPGFDGRLALLDRWDDTFDRMQFFEASAHRIGIQAKAFIDFEEAVNWLWQSRVIAVPGDAESTGNS